MQSAINTYIYTIFIHIMESYVKTRKLKENYLWKQETGSKLLKRIIETMIINYDKMPVAQAETTSKEKKKLKNILTMNSPRDNLNYFKHCQFENEEEIKSISHFIQIGRLCLFSLPKSTCETNEDSFLSELLLSNEEVDFTQIEIFLRIAMGRLQGQIILYILDKENETFQAKIYGNTTDDPILKLALYIDVERIEEVFILYNRDECKKAYPFIFDRDNHDKNLPEWLEKSLDCSYEIPGLFYQINGLDSTQNKEQYSQLNEVLIECLEISTTFLEEYKKSEDRQSKEEAIESLKKSYYYILKEKVRNNKIIQTKEEYEELLSSINKIIMSISTEFPLLLNENDEDTSYTDEFDKNNKAGMQDIVCGNCKKQILADELLELNCKHSIHKQC